LQIMRFLRAFASVVQGTEVEKAFRGWASSTTRIHLCLNHDGKSKFQPSA
jgi:hypothetical protein